MFISFSHGIPRTFFQRYQSCTFIYFAIQHLRRPFNISRDLKNRMGVSKDIHVNSLCNNLRKCAALIF